MREWNLKPGDPLSLNLAADPRMSGSDYCNDQIWELALGGGEPPALALQTTYGLRARSARIFPRFVESETGRSEPHAFATPPIVRKFYPNFIEVVCTPFLYIDVTAEYWVVSSQAISGRFTFRNSGQSARRIRLELNAQLTPAGEGRRMMPAVMGIAPVLVGQTGDLAPVLFMTGGPEAVASPFPSLQLTMELLPGGERQITWAQVALATPEASFEAARQAAARNLDAERARIELLNAGGIEVITGDPSWDAAFALAQKAARGLFMSGKPGLPNDSFVIARQPDYGYSRRGDGGDYSPLWSGQGALEAYYLISLVMPSMSQAAAGLVKNFIHVQADNGSIDWKPGIGGQRSQLLAAPILASLAWKIYSQTEDSAFLEAVFEPLLKFFHAWFDPEQDRDRDGYPEWTHPLQTGLDDHPLFAFWHPWAQGVNITTAESPALGAFLYKESQALIAMANKLERCDLIPELETVAANLRTAIEVSWDPFIASYRYWDRDSHYSSQPVFLAERTGSGEIALRQSFEHPVRLLVKVQVSSENTIRPVIFVHGSSPRGQHLVERITNDNFQWFMGSGSVTGERVYTELEKIEIQGLGDQDRVTLQSVGYSCQDITLLLPLWAGIPIEERVQALVDESITHPDRYWLEYGIASCSRGQESIPDSACQDIHLIWNQLIGEGLLSYGYTQQAASLVTRLMKAVILNLKQDGAFRRVYHAESGQGKGERNALEGLAPLGLFLETLGVRIINNQRLVVSGFNPFPWPVTVKYRGLSVLKQSDKTVVVFPGGQTITVNDPERHVLCLE